MWRRPNPSPKTKLQVEARHSTMISGAPDLSGHIIPGIDACSTFLSGALATSLSHAAPSSIQPPVVPCGKPSGPPGGTVKRTCTHNWNFEETCGWKQLSTPSCSSRSWIPGKRAQNKTPGRRGGRNTGSTMTAKEGVSDVQDDARPWGLRDWLAFGH